MTERRRGTTYVAMLRAVNVGSTWIKMAELSELFLKNGFQNVTTYIQSGNVIFTSPESRDECQAAIARLLEKRLKSPVGVILKTLKEMTAAIEGNPFVKDPEVDATKLHVTFLGNKPARAALAKLGQIQAGPDRFHVAGSIVYVYCPNGYGRTKLSNTAIERALAVPATTRNWNTVNTLRDMAGMV